MFDGKKFLGLADYRHIVQSNPHRIFADLLPKPPVPGVKIDTNLEEANKLIKKYQVNALPVFDSQGSFSGIISRESLLNTVRKKYHNILKLNEKIEGLLRDINRELDLQSILNIALQNTLELLNVHTGWVFLYNESDKKTQIVAWANLPPLYRQNKMQVLQGNCACQRKILEKKEETAIVCLECERSQKIGSKLKYHLTIPLTCHDKTLGIMNLASQKAITLCREELHVLSTMGKSLGIAIMNAQSFQKLKAEHKFTQKAYQQFVENSPNPIFFRSSRDYFDLESCL